MKIEKDTHGRGTSDRPQYLIFLRYGSRPPLECWLHAKTDEAAIAEAKRLFPNEEICMDEILNRPEPG